MRYLLVLCVSLSLIGCGKLLDSNIPFGEEVQLNLGDGALDLETRGFNSGFIAQHYVFFNSGKLPIATAIANCGSYGATLAPLGGGGPSVLEIMNQPSNDPGKQAVKNALESDNGMYASNEGTPQVLKLRGGRYKWTSVGATESATAKFLCVR